MNGRTRLSAALAAVTFGAALLWPALYNGQPIFFGDTSAYIRGADAGVQAVFHRRSAWSLTGGDAIVQRPAAATQSPRAGSAAVLPLARGSSLEDKSVVSGRSPYYGALLYVGDLAGGFWLSIALQAEAVVLAIILMLRAARVHWSPLLLAGGAVIAGVTTAPFFVSFLEPDIFAGVAVLLCAALLGGSEELGLADRLLAFALLAVCVLVHESHVLLVAALLVLGAASLIFRGAHARALRRPALAVLAAAVLVAVAGELAFSAAVKHVIGAPPLRPPFLMARMIEDGPGYRYLRATCPQNGLTICAYLDRLPVAANLFLWDPSTRGVFSAVAPPVRRSLAAEQTRFVLAVLAYAPWTELRDALRDFGTQLTMSGLEEFHYPQVLKQSFEEKIPAAHLQRMKRTAAYRGTMPVGPFSFVTVVAFGLAAIVVLAALLWPRLRRALPQPLIAVTVWIVAGVILNAAVCGILSGPHNRYAARVAWVVPLAALLIGAAARERRGSRVRDAATSAEPA
ncbi:MAG TPA: hypothetical protein VN730_00305 [Steroidobacteraceae bacterium]|nr:hypothetical protein [Steroidobacteraceae bacterium]